MRADLPIAMSDGAPLRGRVRDEFSFGIFRAEVPEVALAVARRVRTGTLSVNGAQWFHVDTPFGGYRQSGLGRENGVAGFEEYLETKVISLPVKTS